MIKTTIIKLIPQFLMPTANKIYAKLFNKSLPNKITSDQYEQLNCLKPTIAYNKYGAYCTPNSASHRPAVKTIRLGCIYEPDTIKFIISNCQDGDIIHAGAFFGDFLPALSAHCHKDAKIWSFEPNSENYHCACITLLLNNINNVVLTNAGLGAKKQQLLMKTQDKNGISMGGASRIVKHGSIKVAGIDSIEVVAIDQTLSEDRNISILHLDVEGHEKQALMGAMKTIKRCLPIIILEVFENRKLLDNQWFAENILILGYKEKLTIHGNSIFMIQT